MTNDERMQAAERLKEARKRAGYESAEQFAEVMKMNPITYRTYERGENAFSKHAVRLSKVLGVTSDWLLAGNDSAGDRDMLLLENLKVDANVYDSGVLMIREVDISSAMGDGAFVESYPELGAIPFRESFLKMLRVNDPRNVFVCKGDGDSMAPTINNQDMVLVDASRNRVTLSDHIWAFTVAGAGMIKRLRPLPDDRVMVLSDNPNVPEQVYETKDIHVVGKVVWIGRMM